MLVTSDLPELLGLSDRVLVLREGRIALELPARPVRPGAGRAAARWDTRIVMAADDHRSGAMRTEMPRLRLRDLTMPLVLAVLAAGFAAASPEFLSPRNLSMLMIELAVTAVLALGMLLVILPGQIDLSAGSGVGLIGGVAAVLVFRAGWPAPAALALATLLALLVWTAMGELIVRTGIPAFIVTLGGCCLSVGSSG